MRKRPGEGHYSKAATFLIRAGKGFSFVAQQKRISAGSDHFMWIWFSLITFSNVFCLLKLGKLNHQDIGQMDFYVRSFEDNMKTATDYPTIGIILCSEKNETIVKYSVLNESQQLFASKNKLYLPTEEELKKEVEQEVLQFKLEHKSEICVNPPTN